MGTKKIVIKEVFKAKTKEEMDKAIHENIVKLITRQQKIEGKVSLH